MTTRARYGEKPATIQEIIFDPDLNIGRFMEKKENHNLRLVSKGFNRAFYDDLKCADAQELQSELQDMRKEPEPCKNTAKVIYKPETGLQRAIMCAIMSKNEARSSDLHQDLHVYLFKDHLETFMDSESVKCFDKNYKLQLTLLSPPNVQQDPLNLHCHGGFRAREYRVAEEGRYPDDAEVVRFTGNTYVAERGEGSGSFRRNSKLIALLDMSTLKTIGYGAFCYCSLSEIVDDMPEVTHIYDHAFALSGLTRLGNMPNLKVIHPHAFSSCEDLEQLGAVEALTEIKESAFLGCQQLTQLKLPNVATIGAHAFKGCERLEQLDMPSVKTIGDRAFERCNLFAHRLDMPSVETIGNSAFEGCSLFELKMPNVETIGNSAFKGCERLEQLDMLNVKTIGDSAFSGCRLLKQPGETHHLTEIGREAFAGCRFKELNVQSLLKMGAYAFSGCNELMHLGNMSKLTEIGPSAFLICVQLNKLHLPKALNSVGNNAFEGCPLGEITVEPGADFECHCNYLANKLSRLKGIQVNRLQAGGFRITYPSESTGVVR